MLANRSKLTPLSGTSPPNTQQGFGMIISTFSCGFGGESIESGDGKSLEGHAHIIRMKLN